MPKPKYFFASFSNDKELSFVDKTEVYVDRNTEGQEVTQLG